MTAVKERLVEMIPRMSDMIPNLEEEEARAVLNIFIKVEEKPKKSKRDSFNALLKHKGSVSVPDDYDYVKDKESYLREKYEGLS